MAVRTIIMDMALGNGQYAGVTSVGELLVAGFGTLTNKSVFNTMNTINAAFNFFGPIPGQQFIITSIAFDGNAGSTVSIYEAANPFTATIDKLVFKMNLRSAGQVAIPFSFGGFLPVSEGVYLNAQTDTQPVNLNIIGYYSPTTHNT